MRSWIAVGTACLLLTSGAHGPAWAQASTACPSDLAAYLPPRAQVLNTSGYAIIRCSVGDDGRYLDCSVKTEAPETFGFGLAAVRMSCLFRAPTGADGKALTAGELVERRIEFRPEKVCVGTNCHFGGSVKVFAPSPALQAGGAADK